jgi:hypothetical protein
MCFSHTLVNRVDDGIVEVYLGLESGFRGVIWGGWPRVDLSRQYILFAQTEYV